MSTASFDADRMYEKINGRADYYRSFGCERLDYFTLRDAAREDVTIDVEFYHLGGAANALGAYAGEKAPGTRPETAASGVGHTARNALFFTHGRYYIRAIGSEESEHVTTALLEIREGIRANLPADPLPWGYALLSGRLGLDPGRIDYAGENAFSFDFASGVYMGALDDDGEAQMFVTVAEQDGAARGLATQFVEGFLAYGEAKPKDKHREVTWVLDRYLGTLATAVPLGPWVVGIKGVKDEASGRAALARLEEGVKELGPEVVMRAREEKAKAVTPEEGHSP